MTPAEVLLVAGAGLAGGAINAVAGGGTLVTFPALLAIGLSSRMATIVSSVGLLFGYAGGSLAYREELAGQRRRMRELAGTSVLGGVGGALLLLVTPDHAFRLVVPYLILISCVLLAMRGPLARRLASRVAPSLEEPSPVGMHLGVFVCAVYGSFFGAGLGVLLLAVLGILLDESIQRLNALKGLLSLLINAVGVVVFILAGHVAWSVAAVLAISAWCGGTLGVSVARRLSPTLLRGAVVSLGVVVALNLIARG